MFREAGTMENEALEKLIKSRRSIRKWTAQEVSEELLTRAVEWASWAPNGGNMQGWRFVVVKNRDLIEAMADAVQAVADRIAAWPEGNVWPKEVERVRRHAAYFRHAPAIIALLMAQYVSAADRILLAREAFDPEAKRILAFRRSAPTAVQSAAAAVATLLLALHQQQLGAVWLGAPLIAKDSLEALLKAPAGMSLASLVAAGYPAEAPVIERKPLDEILEVIR
jgi:nitroreductase